MLHETNRLGVIEVYFWNKLLEEYGCPLCIKYAPATFYGFIHVCHFIHKFFLFGQSIFPQNASFSNHLFE